MKAVLTDRGIRKLVAGNALPVSFRFQIALKLLLETIPLTMFVGRARPMLERMSRRGDSGGTITRAPKLFVIVVTEPDAQLVRFWL